MKAHHFQHHMTRGYSDRAGTTTLKMNGEDEHCPGSGITSANDTIIRAGDSLRKRLPKPSVRGPSNPVHGWGRSGGKITVPPPDPPGTEEKKGYGKPWPPLTGNATPSDRK